MIPTSCIDDFYENPDSVRDFALSLDFKPPEKHINYPGIATKCLSEIDINFFNFSIEKLLAPLFNSESIPEWYATTYFQKIYTFNSDRHHPMNVGWAHKDDEVPFSTLAAVVYLKIGRASCRERV